MCMIRVSNTRMVHMESKSRRLVKNGIHAVMELEQPPLKRRRVCFQEMVDWLRNVAASTDDFTASKESWMDAVAKGEGDYYLLALEVRRALYLKNADAVAAPDDNHEKEEEISNGCTQFLQNQSSSSPLEIAGWRVGPSYQADIPKWECPSPDDPDTLRWLGLRIWPSLHKPIVVNGDYTMKGRSDCFGCERPGSISCIQRQVAKNKASLMHEMRSAYIAMGFHCMGEGVASSWTEQEQCKFKDIVQQNLPASGKNFWDELITCFSYKKKEDLVSYYYNVFQLRRRAYQNHVNPSSIDSDDDEIELSFFNHSAEHP